MRLRRYLTLLACVSVLMPWLAWSFQGTAPVTVQNGATSLDLTANYTWTGSHVFQGAFTWGDGTDQKYCVTFDIASTDPTFCFDAASDEDFWFNRTVVIEDPGAVGFTVPAVEFVDNDGGANGRGTVRSYCLTTNDCNLELGVFSGASSYAYIAGINTTDAGASSWRMGTITSNYVSVSESGAMSFVGTAELDLMSSTASPDTTGEIKVDNDFANMDDTDALVWYDADSVRMLVDLDATQFPSTSNFLLFYNATSDLFEQRTLGTGLVASGSDIYVDDTIFSALGPTIGNVSTEFNNPTDFGSNRVDMGVTELEFPWGTAMVLNATGEISIDTSYDQLVFYGANSWQSSYIRVLDPRLKMRMFTENPQSSETFIIDKAVHDMVPLSLDCITTGTGSPVAPVTIKECTSAGASCVAIHSELSCDSDAANTTTFSDTLMDDGDWIQVALGTVTGTTVTSVTVQLEYMVGRQ